jgi:hypothetical protein
MLSPRLPVLQTAPMSALLKLLCKEPWSLKLAAPLPTSTKLPL